ncbi:MAG: hypothetical protein M3R43_00915 [Acidobacteriota bacterium]|nr:hypothetical protein [Acidobacteriota bacterium]
MTKRILLFLLQLLAFGALLIAGGYWDVIRLYLQLRQSSLNVVPLWKFHLNANYDYIANGLIFAAIMLALIVLFETARKRLKPWAVLSTLAFVMAVAISLIARLGLIGLQP